jgi:hypothetical protein
MPRLHPATRNNLHKLQLARLERLESDDGIALNLRLVLRIRIRHREHRRQPVRRNDELVVRRGQDLSRAGACGRLLVAKHAELAYFGEFQATAFGIRDVVGNDLVAELVEQEELRVPGLAVRLPEDGVARAVASLGFEGRLLGEGLVGQADAVDAHEVGAKIREEDVLAKGVAEGLVDVRGVLARWDRGVGDLCWEGKVLHGLEGVVVCDCKRGNARRGVLRKWLVILLIELGGSGNTHMSQSNRVIVLAEESARDRSAERARVGQLR